MSVILDVTINSTPQAMKTHADELGQTCVYGIGVLAQYGGPYFVDACSTAVNIVNAVVQHEVRLSGICFHSTYALLDYILERGRSLASNS
jgi:hypothetical protein